LRVHIFGKWVRFCWLCRCAVGNHLICISHYSAVYSQHVEPMLPVVWKVDAEFDGTQNLWTSSVVLFHPPCHWLSLVQCYRIWPLLLRIVIYLVCVPTKRMRSSFLSHKLPQPTEFRTQQTVMYIMIPNVDSAIIDSSILHLQIYYYPLFENKLLLSSVHVDSYHRLIH
jgi:hypothetical protein